MNLRRASDEELMFSFQKGNERAYQEIIKRYKDKLLNHIFYFVKSKETAQDVLQDTFVRVYLNKDKYKDIAKVSTWIYTIAINLSKTELAKGKRYDKFSITGKNGEKDYEIRDNHASTDKEILKNEMKQKILDSIDLLEEKFKEIIVLRDIDNLSYEEISEILEIPVGTVKSRINRARLSLRDQIYDYVKS